MGAIGDFIGGPVLGSTRSAKKWNDNVTNWADTQAMYQQGMDEIGSGRDNSIQLQRELLERALSQKPETYFNIYEPIRQNLQVQNMRALGARGLAGSGYAVGKINDLNNKFNFDMLNQANQRINSNNALFMNAANTMSKSYDTSGQSLAEMYGNLGKLRYENSAGKHMLSLWGGQ